MKIYTKGGDKGETSLLGGKRVQKFYPRIEAYGSIDELNANLGMLRDLVIPEDIKEHLLEIQNKLFIIGAILACEVDPKQYNLTNIDDSDIKDLESSIDTMEKELPVLKNFILPGGHVSVSQCHICRCICRRAERNVVSVGRQRMAEEIIITYLNRLSDYLFVLSRKIAKELGIKELNWISGD
jgi:cob(I)alamin adenosyltransferase